MLNIRALREARGVSQVRLAEDSGITAAYLCELESGAKNNPGYKVLSNIAAALGVTVGELLDEATDEQAATSELPKTGQGGEGRE